MWATVKAVHHRAFATRARLVVTTCFTQKTSKNTVGGAYRDTEKRNRSRLQKAVVTAAAAAAAVVVAVVVVVFTINRCFHPMTTSAVHPVSVLILRAREIQIMWSQTETEKN